MELLPGADAYAGSVFAVNYAAFGAIMIAFLLFKPTGLAGMWEDLKAQFGRRP